MTRTRRAVWACLLAASCRAPHVQTRSWPVMGTTASATIVDGDEAGAARAIDAVRSIFDHVDATMSNWSESSELTRLNRSAANGTYRIEDADLAACIGTALEASSRTRGAFDATVGPLVTLWGFRPRAPRVPVAAAIDDALRRVGTGKVHYDPASRSIRFDAAGMELDLGGIAKGYAVDVARARVAPLAWSGMIDLGGNLAWFGDDSAVASVRDALDPDRICAELRLPTGSAIATSSDVENRFTSHGVSYGHILDPRTGRPAETDVVQATAIHPSATVADILSTALFVAGSAGAPSILEAYPGSEAFLVVRDGGRLVIVASASLRGRLTLRIGSSLAPESPRYTLPAATMPPSPTR